MSMNRQQRRLLQRQGQMTEDGAPAPARRAEPAERRTRPAPRCAHAGGPRPGSSFTRSTSRCARWPGPPGAETINYSTVVFITVSILMALIFVLDLRVRQAGCISLQVVGMTDEFS